MTRYFLDPPHHLATLKRAVEWKGRKSNTTERGLKGGENKGDKEKMDENMSNPEFQKVSDFVSLLFPS